MNFLNVCDGMQRTANTIIGSQLFWLHVLLNVHGVRCSASVVGCTFNLLQHLESKVFNKDTWSDVDGFATLLLNELFSRFTHPVCRRGS